MRAGSWLAAVAASLALGCSVDVQGAACATPGSAAGCPSGQACGNDLRCSEEAAGCLATRCTPGDIACQGGNVSICTSANAACGAWQVQTACTATGLVCAGSGSTTACACAPAAGGVLYVDPVAGGSDGTLTATGAAQPPACRLRTLTEALATATSGTRVHAITAAPPATFSAPTEAFPLSVPAGVTLESDTPSNPGSWIIEVAAPVAAPAVPAGHVVHVAAGGSIRGFTIRNVVSPPSAAAAGEGVLCDEDGTATLSDVRVETNNLTSGVRVTAGCIATLSNVTAEGPRLAALYADPTAAGATEVIGGAFTGRGTSPEPGHGIWVRRGVLSVRAPDGVTFSPLTGAFAGGAPLELSGSTGSGLRADAGVDAIGVSVDRVRVMGNGAAGVYLKDLPAGSPVVLQSLDVEGNGATNYYSTRTGGGVLVSGAWLPSLTFSGNRIWRNDGDDQVGLFLPSGALDISGGGSCGASSSVIGSCNASASARDVFRYTSTVPATATYNYWQSIPRAANATTQPDCNDGWTPPPCN